MSETKQSPVVWIVVTHNHRLRGIWTSPEPARDEALRCRERLGADGDVQWFAVQTDVTL